MTTEQKHQESGCTDYLQHSWDSCPHKPKIMTLTEHAHWIVRAKNAEQQRDNLLAERDSYKEAWEGAQERLLRADERERELLAACKGLLDKFVTVEAYPEFEDDLDRFIDMAGAETLARAAISRAEGEGK